MQNDLFLEVAEVRPRLPLVGAQIELVERYPTSYERPSDDIVTSQERYTSADIWPFAVPADAEGYPDGVTAAFRSKTRRLLALPRAWRSHPLLS